jgi:hypothetical protein
MHSRSNNNDQHLFYQPKKEEEVTVDETKVVTIQEMGFNVDRKTIVRCLRIDWTVETAVAAIINNM